MLTFKPIGNEIFRYRPIVAGKKWTDRFLAVASTNLDSFFTIFGMNHPDNPRD